MRILFLASASVLTVGIAASIVGSWTGSGGGTAGLIVNTVNVAFTPRGCFGTGSSSPLFWVMWTTIYTLNTITALYLAIRGFVEADDGSDRDDALFNASAVLGAAFFLTSVWPVVFGRAYKGDMHVASWSLWLSTVIITVSTMLGLVAVVWLHLGLQANLEVGIFIGVPWSIFVGWMIAATGIGFNLSISNDNHSEHRNDQKEPSVEPVVAALIAGIASGLLGSPGLALPMLVACFFVSFTWASGLAGLFALLGVIGGAVRTILVSF